MPPSQTTNTGTAHGVNANAQPGAGDQRHIDGLFQRVDIGRHKVVLLCGFNGQRLLVADAFDTFQHRCKVVVGGDFYVFGDVAVKGTIVVIVLITIPDKYIYLSVQPWRCCPAPGNDALYSPFS